ncbi:MAG: hypothetical protein ACKVIA_00415 [Rhodobacterales bacterium]
MSVSKITATLGRHVSTIYRDLD